MTPEAKAILRIARWGGAIFLIICAAGTAAMPALGPVAHAFKWAGVVVIAAGAALVVVHLLAPGFRPVLAKGWIVWPAAVICLFAGMVIKSAGDPYADAAARAQGFTDMAQYTDAHEAGFAKQVPYLAYLKKKQADEAAAKASAESAVKDKRETAKAISDLGLPDGVHSVIAEAVAKAKAEGTEVSVVGRWINTRKGEGDMLSIDKIGLNYVLVSHTFDDDTGVETQSDLAPLQTRTSGKKRQFATKDNHELYTILADGRLRISKGDNQIVTLERWIDRPRKSVARKVNPKPIEPPSKWQYSMQTDPMHGTAKFAQITSENALAFEFPYAGGQATLILRKRAHKSAEVILEIEGQFVCNSFDGGAIAAKFDDGPIHHYGCGNPSDGKTGVLFIRGAQSFLSRLKKARTVIIEAEFYQEGPRQMTFDVHGLDWR